MSSTHSPSAEWRSGSQYTGSVTWVILPTLSHSLLLLNHGAVIFPFNVKLRGAHKKFCCAKWHLAHTQNMDRKQCLTPKGLLTRLQRTETKDLLRTQTKKNSPRSSGYSESRCAASFPSWGRLLPSSCTGASGTLHSKEQAQAKHREEQILHPISTKQEVGVRVKSIHPGSNLLSLRLLSIQETLSKQAQLEKSWTLFLRFLTPAAHCTS